MNHKKVETANLDDLEVHKVRSYFFEFFCQILKHFKIGIENSDWKHFGTQDEILPEHPDPCYVFKMRDFLRSYKDQESLIFLTDLTKRPAFSSLIE